jgi:alpha-beta hydrolase superfamily lysophospholipase
MNREQISIKRGHITLKGYHFKVENPKAVMVMVHGLGEHFLRLQNMIDLIVEKNISVIGFDTRGHGNSGGKRGHANYDDLMTDISEYLNFVKMNYSELPTLLYGHSLGANIVLNYMFKFNPKVAGVIASSPWLKLAFEPPKFKVALGTLVSSIYPQLVQNSELDTKAISSDPVEVEKYEKDSLIHDKVSAGLFIGGTKQGEWVLENAEDWNHKLLIYHGTKDTLTSPKASAEFASKVKKQHLVEHHNIEDAFHEIHNDKARNELFEIIDKWIDKILGHDLIA